MQVTNNFGIETMEFSLCALPFRSRIKTEYTKEGNTFYLKDYGDIWGKITVKNDIAYFQYGLTEKYISIFSPNLREWVDYYLSDWDVFGEDLNSAD